MNLYEQIRTTTWNKLDDLEKQIVTYRFGGLNLHSIKETSEAMRVSEARVRIADNKVLRETRHRDKIRQPNGKLSERV